MGLRTRPHERTSRRMDMPAKASRPSEGQRALAEAIIRGERAAEHGVTELEASVYIDPFTKGTSSQILPFVIMIGVLLLRPQGLFGWKVIERL